MGSGLTDGWVTVSQPAARRHPLYGIRGWSIVLLLRLFLGAALSTISVARLIFLLVKHDQPVGQLLTANISMAMLWALIFLGLGVALLKKNVWFINVYVSVVAVGILLTLAAPLVDTLIRGVPADRIFAKVPSAIWLTRGGFAVLDIALCGYVLLSRRINVTTKNRVRPDDPILKAG